MRVWGEQMSITTPKLFFYKDVNKSCKGALFSHTKTLYTTSLTYSIDLTCLFLLFFSPRPQTC